MEIKRTYAAAPYIVIIPIAIAQFVAVFQSGAISVAIGAALMLFGAFSWTFIEYLLHRFAFHSSSKHPLMKPFNSTLHLWHHQKPTALEYVAAPMSLAIPVYAIYVGFVYLLSGDRNVSLMIGNGLALGYLLYEYVHFAAHQHHVKLPGLKYLKRYHLMHHFRDKNNYFGVTSPLWDIVFGTKPSEVSGSSRSPLPKTGPV